MYQSAGAAGATFKIDETKWISIGARLRTSFAASKTIAGRDGGKWSKDFDLNNIRLYVNGQLFEYLKLEFNTECQLQRRWRSAGARRYRQI